MNKNSRCIPLSVLFSKSHHHNVRVLEKRGGAHGVHGRSHLVPVGSLFLHAQNVSPAIVAVFMAGIGRGQSNGQAVVGDAFGNHLSPVGMDFACITAVWCGMVWYSMVCYV